MTEKTELRDVFDTFKVILDELFEGMPNALTMTILCSKMVDVEVAAHGPNADADRFCELVTRVIRVQMLALAKTEGGTN